jgi:hypothetical protein|tara:strand:+ start:22 stop:441 length:420 start_codon:yes stop_codon:yes gene_type:complete
MAKKKTKEELLLETFVSKNEGLRSKREKDDWGLVAKVSKWLGYSSKEALDIVLTEANRKNKKIWELPYHLQKQFYKIYTHHNNPKDAFADEKMIEFFNKPGVNIACNSVQRLKNIWTDFNKSLGVQRKGNYSKKHFMDN